MINLAEINTPDGCAPWLHPNSIGDYAAQAAIKEIGQHWVDALRDACDPNEIKADIRHIKAVLDEWEKIAIARASE